MQRYVFIYPQIKRLTGAQRLILALAEAIAATSAARVTLLTHQFAAECRPALAANVELTETRQNLNLTGNHYLDSIIEYLAVPGLLGHVPPDTAAICFFGPPSLPGLWWAKHIRRLKIPLLYFCYEPPRAAYTDRAEVTRRMGRLGVALRPLLWLYRPLDRYLARQATEILVNGQYGQQLIQETYARPATIITHGANLAASQLDPQQLRQKYNLDETAPLIISVNHLHPRKRVKLLIEALPPILAKHPQTKLLIVGKGPEEAELRQLAQQLGVAEQVIFAGFVPDEELAAYYAAATLYAHPGHAETFGLSILEASMSRLSVVAAAEGGPLEILQDGQTGFLIEATSENFVEKINWLLDHPDEATAMGQANARQATERYSWQKGAEDFLRLARNLKAIKL